jgi:hypothetical protein
MISARGPDSASAEEPGIDVRVSGRPCFASLARLPDPSTRVGQPRRRRATALSFTSSASANGTGGAAMFGGNASERRGRSGSYSAAHNGPFTVDVVFELNNHELLITDYALDKIAD